MTASSIRGCRRSVGFPLRATDDRLCRQLWYVPFDQSQESLVASARNHCFWTPSGPSLAGQNQQRWVETCHAAWLRGRRDRPNAFFHPISLATNISGCGDGGFRARPTENRQTGSGLPTESLLAGRDWWEVVGPLTGQTSSEADRVAGRRRKLQFIATSRRTQPNYSKCVWSVRARSTALLFLSLSFIHSEPLVSMSRSESAASKSL